MKCPTCSQDVPKDTSGLVQARVATKRDAVRGHRALAQQKRLYPTQAELDEWETFRKRYPHLMGN